MKEAEPLKGVEILRMDDGTYNVYCGNVRINGSMTYEQAMKAAEKALE